MQPEPGTPEHSGIPAPEAGAEEATPATDDLARELAELRDRHLRLAAEYDNYRRRAERERVENRDRAQAEVVKRFLDVLDDLQRVAHFTPETASAQALLEGAQMVERKFLRALEAAGLEPIQAEGQPFNPEFHEALTTVPTQSREDDHTVADVYQQGYTFRGTLLRPARVRVKSYEG
ncbi:MAG: nucleotide exchange factor GrpE [Gemmatimonadota bacterium]|nr:nucleotide exchange factor GrpE [Gemmatimonadota bacterium]